MKEKVKKTFRFLNIIITKIARLPFIAYLSTTLIFFLLITACKKKDDSTPPPTPVESTYDQVNLVADAGSFGATRVDTNLNNAWGIAIGPSGYLWIASNHKGLTTIYDRNGSQELPPVAIPFHGDHHGG